MRAAERNGVRWIRGPSDLSGMPWSGAGRVSIFHRGDGYERACGARNYLRILRLLPFNACVNGRKPIEPERGTRSCARKKPGSQKMQAEAIWEELKEETRVRPESVNCPWLAWKKAVFGRKSWRGGREGRLRVVPMMRGGKEQGEAC